MRDGDTLSRIGKMAELFDDFSPLQLLASGVFNGRSFTIVGRLQYKYAKGTWTEWYAAFGDGSTGFLSEDNGAYVFTLPASLQREIPEPAFFRVGATTAIDGKPFSVASSEQVSLLSAQGELPHLPALGQPFAMVELRSAEGEVLSIDYGPALGGQKPVLALGRSVLLDDLKLTGLRDASVREEKGGRQFGCPNCGAVIAVQLASSKTITCRSCNSLIDLSQGVGAELKHATQDEPVNPLIPLGSVGQLQGANWQVVGFQHRLGHGPDDDLEFFGWDEYLLYHGKRGFIFLVDAEDGWSVVKPVTGAPFYKDGANVASYLKTIYTFNSRYSATTTYAAGEFYWQVARGEKTSNRDFSNGKQLLSQETTGSEVTWSSGSKIDALAVATAFKLNDRIGLFKRSDATPLSSGSRMGCVTIIVIVLLILLFLLLIGRCSSCNPNVENCSSSSSGGSRTSGGSYGGFSGSSGGHK